MPNEWGYSDARLNEVLDAFKTRLETLAATDAEAACLVFITDDDRDPPSQPPSDRFIVVCPGRFKRGTDDDGEAMGDDAQVIFDGTVRVNVWVRVQVDRSGDATAILLDSSPAVGLLTFNDRVMEALNDVRLGTEAEPVTMIPLDVQSLDVRGRGTGKFAAFSRVVTEWQVMFSWRQP